VVLSSRSLVLALVLMVGAVMALHFTCLWFFPKAELDPYRLSDFYPLSVFKLRWPRPYQLGIAALYAAAFFGAWPRLSRTRSLPWLLVSALGFAVLSNLLHGFRNGLDFPTATTGDAGIEYYHDARIIPGPNWLLRHYNAVQFELLEHSRTHPPGPVLLYWLLWQAFRHPAAISVAVCAVSLWLSFTHFRRLLRLVMGEEPVGALLVFSLIPSVLVYGLATVDAVIAGLFLAALVCFVDDSRRLGWLASAAWLWLCLMFTFAALVLLPILGGFELLRRRSLRRFARVVGAATLLLALTQLCLGFDWGAAFWKASVMENEQGFLLFAHPRRYVWYRLGGVAEILLFFSPFLALLAWRGLRPLKARSADGFALAWLGPAALGCFLLAGALKIGEAARACLFILPYLALPALAYWRELSDQERFRVASGVWGFGLVMQLFGFYQW
jgi:hypothetical protein